MKPDEDTFIDGRHSRRNYGGQGVLHARAKKGPREAILRFNLSELRNKCIKYVRLSLYSLADAHSGGAIIRLAPDAKRHLFARATRWKENDATWSSIKQSLFEEKRLRSLGRVDKNSWVHADVTAGIKIDSYDLTLCIASEGDSVKYASKERSGHAPSLTVTLC